MPQFVAPPPGYYPSVTIAAVTSIRISNATIITTIIHLRNNIMGPGGGMPFYNNMSAWIDTTSAGYPFLQVVAATLLYF
jgi:hypothetical protein